MNIDKLASEKAN